MRNEVNPDLSRFRQLVALAELGSYRRASERLGISHSALSQTINKLESHYRTPLFIKGYRSVVATEAGKVLADAARQIIRSLEIAEQSIQAITGGQPRGQLVFGADPIVSLATLERLMAEMRGAYPEARIGYRQARWMQSESLLVSGEVDLYIGPKPDDAGENLHFSSLRCPQAILACRPHHPALDLDVADLNGLQAYPLLSPSLPDKLLKAMWVGLTWNEATARESHHQASIVEDSSVLRGMVRASDCLGWSFAEGKEFGSDGLVELARVDLSLVDAALIVACETSRRDFPPTARFFEIASRYEPGARGHGLAASRVHG